MDDFRQRKRQWEAAADALLAAYGERRRLREIREANRRAWERRQRRACMKMIAGATLIVGAIGTAGAATLFQAPTQPGEHFILQWWPVITFAGLAIIGFVKLREGHQHLSEKIDAKADEKVLDQKLERIEAKIDEGIDKVMFMVNSYQREVVTRIERLERKDAS